ncbi:MAG: hypothetical protein WCD70_11185 [Alphaproteobacteria bacterium]
MDFNNGHSVVDGIVRDESAAGLRIETGTPMPLPDHVVIRFCAGTRIEARRCWAAIKSRRYAAAPADFTRYCSKAICIQLESVDSI